MPDYKEIYLRNVYEVDLDSRNKLFFSLENFINHSFFDTPFAIITAYNPGNHKLNDAANRERDMALYKELHNDYALLRAIGCLDDHCEAGFAVLEISLEEAIKIGRSYGQYAIFYNSVYSQMYVRCDDRKVIVRRETDA